MQNFLKESKVLKIITIVSSVLCIRRYILQYSNSFLSQYCCKMLYIKCLRCKDGHYLFFHNVVRNDIHEANKYEFKKWKYKMLRMQKKYQSILRNNPLMTCWSNKMMYILMKKYIVNKTVYFSHYIMEHWILKLMLLYHIIFNFKIINKCSVCNFFNNQKEVSKMFIANNHLFIFEINNKIFRSQLTNCYFTTNKN